MLSRRELVSRLAAGAAVAAAAGAGTAGVALARSRGAAVSGSESDNNEFLFPRGDEVVAQPEVAAAGEQAAPAIAAAPEPPPWELLRPLERGSVVAHGWRVADLTPVVDGACVVSLQNARGRTHRIHICRNDGRPQGLVFTESLDLVVMNGGQGDLPTDEGLAQAVAELAHVLAANEVGGRHAPVMTAMLSQRERERQFATAAGQLR